MKDYVQRPLLIITFTVFSLFLLFHIAPGSSTKSVPQSKVANSVFFSKDSAGLPMRLLIPAINVNAAILHLGVTSGGQMEVPDNAVDVGWFKLGPRPGEIGSAVISGHFDGKNGEEGVFTNLNKLTEGDKLYVEDGRGTYKAFVVSGSRAYDPGYADDVFSRNDGAHLNFITCGGVWDNNKKSYTERLVIFTDASIYESWGYKMKSTLQNTRLTGSTLSQDSFGAGLLQSLAFAYKGQNSFYFGK
ncbi:MAG: class F sortase [Candidatus Curtissbacteria bacterium]|nr:class F sortase [Candidatus Curtissbacteria bacterium]